MPPRGGIHYRTILLAGESTICSGAFTGGSLSCLYIGDFRLKLLYIRLPAL